MPKGLLTSNQRSRERSWIARKALPALASAGEMRTPSTWGGTGALADRHGRPTLRDRSQAARSEEHTSELQSPMHISYAVLCLKKNKSKTSITNTEHVSHLSGAIQPHSIHN